MSGAQREPRRFVSRAGEKLDAALEAFHVDLAEKRCADFGCNVGGFTDCMLRRGARSVIAIDTGYGTLAWTLRNDPRVETRERTNALHAEPPIGGVDLVTVDLAWTQQRLAIPAALRWLAPEGRIVTLIKPHYEVDGDEKAWLERGFLPQVHAPAVLDRVLSTMPALGAEALGCIQSPLVGGKTSRTLGVPGNVEYLALLRAAPTSAREAEKRLFGYTRKRLTMAKKDNEKDNGKPGQTPNEKPHEKVGSNGEALPEIPAAFDRIMSVDIERELHDSYLTYAMSTIMDRALPDVRDGLKPSQRRILVAMHDLRLAPGKKHIKCAKICGDTSGNYHPHGESVIYPTLVNLGQDWKTRCLLIDKQGNFGSIEGDPPAAMRYTEARMTGPTMAMMEDIDKDTVDFKPNYDDRLTEPTVLPAKLPNLLVNGSSGIAVGMASSMPPHNLREICNAIVATIDDPNIPLERLVELAPGPDFPTGGAICGRRGVIEAYATGRGRVVVRGKVHHEKSDNRDIIVIDEIPYQIVQSNLIEKIVEASKAGRIEDISDVRNHSGRDARTRIRVVLKKGADPNVVEKQLYEFTPLQSSFSIINIALVNGQPKTLTFRQLIQCYIDHRKDVVRRRTLFLLRQAKQQAHKLEGLIYAVCDIDEVIAIIRSSRTRDEAIDRLQTRAFRIAPENPRAKFVPKRLLDRVGADGVMLTRVQAEAIGALRLIQLVGLELERLSAELNSIMDEIDGFDRILADERLILDIVKEDCIEISDRFGDDRKTTIEDSEVDDFAYEELIQEHQVVVTISHQGYVKRLPVDTYRSQARGGTGIKGAEKTDDDFVEQLFVGSTHDVLLCFTNTGRVFRMKVWQIPELARTSRGRNIVNLLELKEGEKIRAFLSIADFEKSEDYLFFGTAEGKVKRTSLKDYRNVNRSGIIAINLNEGDRLVGVLQTQGDDQVLLATAGGKAIRFEENDVRVMGRAAAGVKGMELGEEDQIVGMVRCVEGADLLTVTRNGYGKRTPLEEYLVQSEDGSTRPQGRGGLGRIDIQTTERNGPVVDIRVVHDSDSLMFISAGGMLVRTPAATISRIGRNTQGVRVVRIREDDQLISAATIADSPTAGDEDSQAKSDDQSPSENRSDGPNGDEDSPTDPPATA